MTLSQKQRNIKERIGKSDSKTEWFDWTWHIKHTVKDIATFEHIMKISLDEKKKKQLKETVFKFPLSITPYYLSLIDREQYENDPVFLQSFPSVKELIISKYDMLDPLSEDKDSPVPLLTHRYPDRVLIHLSNVCSMYCRHCTRKRKVGDLDNIPGKEELQQTIDYVRDHSEIRDVLLSGGDPLMLSDDYLEWVLSSLSEIKHVEIVRIGTRRPVVLPYRITENLVKILKQFQPLYINTHFNHPRELTSSAERSLKMLADAGIVLGNQTVLLAGVNDCSKIIKKLCNKLLQNRVRPYYLYQCDLSEGLSHFRTPIGKGMEIIENMIGHTSGLAVPTYVVDAPGGGGKIPIMPNYLISWSTNKVVLRNYEGVITTYKEPDAYEPVFCDRDCDSCTLQLNLESAEEDKAVGIRKLLEDKDKSISLTPRSNERLRRRKK